VPPQYRRYLPLFIVALLLLVLLPLLRHSGSSGLSDKERAAMTFDAQKRIDTGQQAFKARTGRYTSNLSDLMSKALAADLAIGMNVQLNASTDGKTYLSQIESSVLSLVRWRSGAKVTDNCLSLKSGIKCP
jgi:hypothetical protein